MFESRKKLFVYVAAGIITLNWSLYIWAVNAGYVIQTCMGYFLEPLVVCCFGVVFIKKRQTNGKKISMIFAFCGLMVMIIGYREIPFIALGLGLSFAIYSAIKKASS